MADNNQASSSSLPPQILQLLIFLTTGGFTNPQRKALAFLKCFTASLSLVSASLLIYMVSRKLRQNRSDTPTFHRFLLGLSVYDVLYEIWLTIGVMAVPSSPLVGGFGAMGTRGSCTAQGFFLTLSLGSFIYNAGLSVYYVLVIRYGCHESRVAKYLEPVVHSLAFSLSLAFGIYGLQSKVYNPPIAAPPEVGCFAFPYPPLCAIIITNVVVPCERGQYFLTWYWSFFGTELLFVTIVVIMSILLYWTVRTRYRTANRYASQESEPMRQRTRAVACQAFLFAATCVYANMWNYLILIGERFHFSIPFIKVIIFNGNIGFSSQGLFNFLIYTRPRYMRLRERKPELGRCGALAGVIFGEQQQQQQQRSFGDGGGGGSGSGGVLRASRRILMLEWAKPTMRSFVHRQPTTITAEDQSTSAGGGSSDKSRSLAIIPQPKTTTATTSNNNNSNPSCELSYSMRRLSRVAMVFGGHEELEFEEEEEDDDENGDAHMSELVKQPTTTTAAAAKTTKRDDGVEERMTAVDDELLSGVSYYGSRTS